MKKIFIFLLLQCFIGGSPLCLLGQTNYFLEAYRQHHQYWDAIPDSIKYASGSGYKQDQRTMALIERRVGEDGTLTAYVNAISNIPKPKQFLNPWIYSGPYEIPEASQSRGQTSKGWIWSCNVNPANHDEIYVGGHHGGVWKTTNGGQDWIPLTDDIPEIGGVPSIQVIWGAGQNGKDIIYIVSSSTEGGLWGYSAGVFKSVDSGENWFDINTGILSNIFPSTFLKNCARRIMLHPNNNDVLYLITNDNIYKTTNAGLSWINIKNDTFNWWDGEFGWYDIAIAINGQSETIFVTGHKIIKSTDGGNNWLDITNLVTGEDTIKINRCEVAVDNEVFSDRAYFFFLKGTQQITRHDISTNTYTVLDNFGANGVRGANRTKMGIEISKTRSIINGADTEPFLYVYGLQVWDYNPYRTSKLRSLSHKDPASTASLNGPGRWVHDDIRSMQILEDNGDDMIFIGNDGGFSVANSNSFGGSCGNFLCWSNLSGGQNGLHCNEFYGVSTINSVNEILLGGLQDCGAFVFNHPNSPENWIKSSSGDGSRAALINPNNPNIQFMACFYNNFIRRSTDGGLTFVDGTPYSVTPHPNSPLKFRPDDPEIMYLGEGKPNYRLTRFNEASTSWSRTDITPNIYPDTVKNNISAIGVCESNPNVLYAASGKNYLWTGTIPEDFENCIWRTNNSTASPPVWVDISKNLSGLKRGWVTDIVANNFDENEIYVSFSLSTAESKLFKGTWDNQTQIMSWNDFSNGLPCSIPINGLEFDKTNLILYAATDVGIYYCNPNESPINWILYNENLPRKMVNDIAINYSLGKIYAATFGRGMWENKLICNNSGTELFVNTNTIWDEKYLTGNLTIQNSSSLTINDILGISDDLSITIKSGSVLILNGFISSNCDGNGLWNGSIIVEDGGGLILNSTSQIGLKEFGLIKIEDGGTLFYRGGILNLNSNNSIIEIAGDLHIGENATFTFSGDGYILFNKPGTDSADGNIFADSGASFVLEGTGKSDKKMEVQQSTLRFPTLAELRFESCKIEMGEGSTGIGARMQTTTSTSNITFDDVLVTSDNGQHNNHRGFHFYGQSNVTINDCIFEYGREGLKGVLNYGGNALSISNSTFRYNTTGIEIDRKGLNLEYCFIYDNNLYGIICQNMEFSSTFNYCYINDNYDIGIVWTGNSTANLSVNSSLIDNHNSAGIFADGQFSLDLNCTHVNNNFYGIFMLNGAKLLVGSNSENNLTENDYTVYYAPFNYGGTPVLQYGHNQLQAKNDGYTFTGAVNTMCFQFMGQWYHFSIVATNNRWEQNQNAQPQLSVNHNLYSYNCSPNTILIDNNPAYIDCLLFYPMGSEGGDSEINNYNSNIVYNSSLPSVELSTHSNTTIDEAIDILRNNVSNANSESEFVMIIADYINIINTAGTSLNVDAIKLIDIAYSDMMHAISEFYAVTNYNRDNSSINLAIDDVKSLNSLLLEKDFVNDIKFFEYKLNNALLERFRDQYDVSISELIQIINDITVYQSSINSENDYLFWDNRRLYVDRWLCVVRIEKEFFDGIITIDEYTEKIRECGSSLHLLHEKMDTKSGNKNAGEIENDENSDNIEMESQINSSEFYVTPNPNSGSFSVYFYSESNNNKLKIFNTLGQEVETRKINEIGDQTVVFEGFAKGQYTIAYYAENKLVKSIHLIVK